jgi:hypothetical protein
VRLQGIVGMRDDISASFEQAVAHAKEREKAAEAFEVAFHTSCEKVIVPALNEVREMLQAAGWTCQVSSSVIGDEDHEDRITGVRLEVNKETTVFREHKLEIRGHVAFRRLPNQVIAIYVVTSHKEESAAKLSEITHDSVQRTALAFFRKVSSCW